MLQKSHQVWEDEAGCEQQIVFDSVDLVAAELPQWISDIRVAAEEQDVERLLGVLQAMRQSMEVVGTASLCNRTRDIEDVVACRRWRTLRSLIESLSAECAHEASHVRFCLANAARDDNCR